MIFSFPGLEDVVALINDLLLSASRSSSGAKKTTFAVKDEIEKVTGRSSKTIADDAEGTACPLCSGYFLHLIDAELPGTFNIGTSTRQIDLAIAAASPIKRHQELHQKVPASLLPSVLLLVKAYQESVNSRGYHGLPVFDLIDGITKMGSSSEYASLYFFSKYERENEVICSNCHFRFLDSTPYLRQAHEALCIALISFGKNDNVVEAVKKVASFALQKGGISHPVSALIILYLLLKLITHSFLL